jgi:tetratricopeptide (TPR) repeat protein
MEPQFAAAHHFLGGAYVQKAIYEEAISHLQTAVVLSERRPDKLAALGHAYAVFGENAKAQKVLEELRGLSEQRFVSAYDFAILYAGLGEKGQALEWLERAYEERAFSLLMGLKVEPKLDSLRSDPRFQELARRAGLSA